MKDLESPPDPIEEEKTMASCAAALALASVFAVDWDMDGHREVGHRRLHTPMTPKLKKARAKAKSARKARRKNR